MIQQETATSYQTSVLSGIGHFPSLSHTQALKLKAVSTDRSPVTGLFATAAVWGVVVVVLLRGHQDQGETTKKGPSQLTWMKQTVVMGFAQSADHFILGESWLLGRGLRSALSHVADLLSEDHAVQGCRNYAAATVQLQYFCSLGLNYD